MRKLFYLIFTAMVCGAFGAHAAPGDTTWVQAQSDIQMPNYGDYDSSVLFPSGTTTYRKIYMVFTLGKYQCPAGSQYCGDWDYTVQNFLMTPGGDTLELGRLITPYANVSYARFPWTWKQRYIFDVTDYYPVLKNNAKMRIHYSGYSGGFTANIKFAFVEGTPDRNVLRVDRMWQGSYNYGNASDPIENHVAAVSKTAPAGTAAAALKFTVTGHGADNAGCSEFCKKTYYVKLNGTQIDQKDIWRDNCGFNDLSPQSGTWIYDRGNWCPGALVYPNFHNLTGVTAGNNYSLDVDFEAHTASGGSPSYTVEGTVFYYGNYNKTLDASLEEVLSPTNYEGRWRSNPMCGTPTIRVRNSGSTPITHIRFEYGVQGTYLPQYVWTGTLAPLEEKEIALPEPWELRQAIGTGNVFIARIINVNDQADADATNNELKTTFTAAPTYPVLVRVSFKTNNVANETRWKIYDLNGNVVAQRNGVAANTLYLDSLNLTPSCYKLVMEDDGCDGLSFWANSAAGSGSFSMRNGYNNLPLSLPSFPGTDFGCGFTQYFKTGFTLNVPNASVQEVGIQVYPNPAQQSVAINIGGLTQVSGTIRILDATGRVAMTRACTSSHLEINTSLLANGLYQVIYQDDTDRAPRLQTPARNSPVG